MQMQKAGTVDSSYGHAVAVAKRTSPSFYDAVSFAIWIKSRHAKRSFWRAKMAGNGQAGRAGKAAATVDFLLL